MWWISSIIGLQEGLVIHIRNLKVQSDIKETAPITIPLVTPEVPVVPVQASSDLEDKHRNIHPDRLVNLSRSDSSYCDSESESASTSESDIHNEIVNNCEAFMEQSKQERKAIGRKTRQVSRVIKRKAKKKTIKTIGTQTEGIEGSKS
jgi:hypothetical protein